MDKIFFIGKVGGRKKPRVPPPTLLTAPTISGTPAEGSTLTRTVGTYSTDNPPVTLTGQWDYGPGIAGPWHPLVGENGATIVLPVNNMGYDLYFSYREYATDAGGGSARVARSNAIGPLIFVPAEVPEAPVNLVAPVVSGTPEVTQMLTVTVGTWTGADSISRQWQRSPDGVSTWTDIAGAASAAYLLDPADETQYIRVRETGTNIAGSASVTSNSVGPVTAAAVGGYQITQITDRGNIGVLAEPFVTPGLPLPEAIPLSISRNGYSTAGVATRYTLTTQARFKRYDRLTADPNVQPPLDDQVSFDDNAVVGDLVTQPGFGSVPNNSTLVMPVARMQHVDNDYKIVGNSLTVGACGAAFGAREQRFFALVRHSLSVDGVATATVSDVTNVTPHIYQTGLSVQSYTGTFDLSAIPDGSSVQIDTEGFPWYGDTTVKSKRATTNGALVGDYSYPGGFVRQYFFKHAALAAARPVAYVHEIAGNNATGVVGYADDPASQTAASAAPFQTVLGALTAIAAANNTNHGFSAMSGAIVRLKSDITAGALMTGMSYHRGSSIRIEKDPVSFPSSNARINMSANLATGTPTGIGASTNEDSGYFGIYLAGITIARQGTFYIDNGRWVLIDGSGFINDGAAPTSASRLVNNAGIVYFGDGSVQGDMPGVNIWSGYSAKIASFCGARGMTATGFMPFPDTILLGCRFTNGVLLQAPWASSPPDIHGSLAATMYAEGSFLGKIPSGNLWRYASSVPAQALVAINCVLERANNGEENVFGISSDGQGNSTTAGVLFYGVTQIGYNLAGRGNSFYADNVGDTRLHPFPVYFQSIIARNAWKGAPFTPGEGANPAHLDGAEWYGMGVGRRYNGYIWNNQFQRPIGEAGEVGAVHRNISALDAGGGYDPNLDFVNWQSSLNSVSSAPTTSAGNGDYRIKTTSIWHGIVAESALKYDIEGNLRPATGDSPGAYVAQ